MLISGSFRGYWWRTCMSKIPQSCLSPSPLPYHLQCRTSLSASSVISRAYAHLVPAKTQNGQAPRGYQGQEGLGEVVAGTYIDNLFFTSGLISYSNLCFLQASAVSIPCNTVMCLPRKGNLKSTIKRLD